MRKHLSVLALAARGTICKVIAVTILAALLSGALLRLVPAYEDRVVYANDDGSVTSEYYPSDFSALPGKTGAAAVCAEDRVVRNKERVFEHLLDDRVPALRDADFIRKIDLGAAVVVVDGGACKAAKHVQCSDCLRGFLHALRLLGNSGAQLRENFVFQ